MLDLGGLSRANPDALLNLSRSREPGGSITLSLALNVTRAIEGARVEITDGDRQILSERAALDPAATFRRQVPGVSSAGTYAARVTDAAGAVVIRQTEGVYDYAPKSEIRTGAQPVPQPPAVGRATDADVVAAGTEQELDGQLLPALATYREGLAQFPDSLELLRSTGRLMVALKQYDAAAPLLSRVLSRVSNDREAAYYLGVAERERGRTRSSLVNWEIAQQYGTLRPAALLGLAAEAWRGGARSRAIDLLHRATVDSPGAVRTGAMQAALLRVAGETREARDRLAAWRTVDPTSSFLRYEATRLGNQDEPLWAHLAADPERVLELAVDYMRFGLYDEAVALLARAYPEGPEVVSEPGMPKPGSYPLIAYYRGFCRYALGQDGGGPTTPPPPGCRPPTCSRTAPSHSRCFATSSLAGPMMRLRTSCLGLSTCRAAWWMTR